MLDKAAIEGLKINVKIEEFENYLDTIIDTVGNEFNENRVYADSGNTRYTAIRVGELGEVVEKCFELKGIISAIRSGVDCPVEELYKYVFRNMPVALNLIKNK